MSHVPKSLPYETSNLLPCLCSLIPFLAAHPTIPIPIYQHQMHLEASPTFLLKTDLQRGRMRGRDSSDLEGLLCNFLLMCCLKDDAHRGYIILKKRLSMGKPSHLVSFYLAHKNVFCSFTRITVSHFRCTIAMPIHIAIVRELYVYSYM